MAGYTPANRGNKTANRVGPAVSRQLRAANFNISPSARMNVALGMFVSAKDQDVTVLVDLGLDSKNLRVANQVASVVAAFGTGVEVYTNADGSVFVWFRYAA